MAFRAPLGTEDILPEQVPLWRRVEETVHRVFGAYGYEELRTPILEYTKLFHKSTGEVTDIVEKEMFTFGQREDEETLSLRPEITPSIVRVLIEQNLFKKKNFWKLYYLGRAFRYERPQKGRLREFHQLGVEAIGSADPLVDAETVLVYWQLLKELGCSQVEVRLNSIGCPECRPAYRELLKKAIQPNLATFCGNCQRRIDRNVFRILDCKADAEKTEALPKAIDHSCEKCKTHFGRVRDALRDVPHVVDPRIVRGLDYYTKTVYEFTSNLLGAQSAVGAGGRYDTLVRDMGGPDVGAVGFASGVERILLILEALKVSAAPPALDFYAAAATEDARADVFRIANALRAAGLAGDLDFEARSLKAQMRSANKTGARYVVMVGTEEIRAGNVKVKDMKDGTEKTVPLDEARSLIKGGKP